MVFTTWCADTHEVHSFGALVSARGSNLSLQDPIYSEPARQDSRGSHRPELPQFLGSHNRRTLGFVYPSLFFLPPSHPGLNPAGSPAEVSFVYLC